jgi:acetyl-CoA synthetase (ADP-forming)
MTQAATGAALLERVASEGRSVLMEHEAKELLRSYGIPMGEFALAINLREALAVAKRIGYPVALKIASPDILHKTDVGGVALDIRSDDELKVRFEDMLTKVKKRSPRARISGIVVEKMMPRSTEVIIGMIRDPQFGPTMMFGLGGLLVEVFRDVAFRIAPIDAEGAMEMMKKIKGYKILSGYRGSPRLDLEALADILVKASKIAMEIESINEMEMNPTFAYEVGASVIDARIILQPKHPS